MYICFSELAWMNVQDYWSPFPQRARPCSFQLISMSTSWISGYISQNTIVITSQDRWIRMVPRSFLMIHRHNLDCTVYIARINIIKGKIFLVQCYFRSSWQAKSFLSINLFIYSCKWFICSISIATYLKQVENPIERSTSF